MESLVTETNVDVACQGGTIVSRTGTRSEGSTRVQRYGYKGEGLAHETKRVTNRIRKLF